MYRAHLTYVGDPERNVYLIVARNLQGAKCKATRLAARFFPHGAELVLAEELANARQREVARRPNRREPWIDVA